MPTERQQAARLRRRGSDSHPFHFFLFHLFVDTDIHIRGAAGRMSRHLAGVLDRSIVSHKVGNACGTPRMATTGGRGVRPNTPMLKRMVHLKGEKENLFA